MRGQYITLQRWFEYYYETIEIKILKNVTKFKEPSWKLFRFRLLFETYYNQWQCSYYCYQGYKKYLIMITHRFKDYQQLWFHRVTEDMSI